MLRVSGWLVLSSLRLRTTMSARTAASICYRIGGVDPGPLHAFGSQARFGFRPVARFAFPLDLQQHGFPGGLVNPDSRNRHYRDVNAIEMAVQRSDQIERNLESAFLAWIVMHEQKHIFHHGLLGLLVRSGWRLNPRRRKPRERPCRG
jgi:hypothetical protein